MIAGARRGVRPQRATPTLGSDPNRQPTSCRIPAESIDNTGEGDHRMARVRVAVGTRKGAFLLTSDEGRKKWEVSGPHFGGWEIYHVKGSPVDPDRVYASQSS